METTNPQGEVAQDPVEAIAGILEREQQTEEVQEAAPEVEAESPETEEVSTDESESDGLDEVEYEGNQYRLPKELKEALLRNKDYTQKTQEVAEQRRLIEAQQEAVRVQTESVKAREAFHQQALSELGQIEAAKRDIAQFEQVNWNALSDTDPVQAQKLWFQYQTTVQQHQRLSEGLQGKYQQFQQGEQQRRQELIQKGMEALKKDIPNWSTDYAKELFDAGKANYGFSDSELSQIYDPRFVKVLADAAAYRKLKASKAEVTKKVANIGKTIQPGVSANKKQAQAQAFNEQRNRLKKTGKVEDAAALIAKFI